MKQTTKFIQSETPELVTKKKYLVLKISSLIAKILKKWESQLARLYCLATHAQY